MSSQAIPTISGVNFQAKVLPAVLLNTETLVKAPEVKETAIFKAKFEETLRPCAFAPLR